MIRLVAVWSPAAVTAAMALWVWQFGRNDVSVIVFLLVMTVALVLHTYQLIKSRHKHNGGRHA